MEDDDKLPLKRVELSLAKFNEVAIPHHLDLLRQHKANIIKYTASGSGVRARAEQAAAARAAGRLRALLAELDALRGRVRAQDLPRYDAATHRARDLTLRAVVDYLAAIECGYRELLRPPALAAPPAPAAPPALAGSAPPPAAAAEPAAGQGQGQGEGEGEGEVRALHEPLLQLHVDEREAALQEREAALRAWAALQQEVRALHDVWQHLQAAALAQRALAAAAGDSCEAAAGHVRAARGHLSVAERLRVGGGAGAGAALGALLGGPLGLVAGLKAGAAAALGGSLLGYCGARLLRGRAQACPPTELGMDPTQASD